VKIIFKKIGRETLAKCCQDKNDKNCFSCEVTFHLAKIRLKNTIKNLTGNLLVETLFFKF
jgi:hypothetical protein